MKSINQEDFIKSVYMNHIDGEAIITLIYQNNRKITKEEMEKLLYVVREFYDYLLFCGYSNEQTHELFKIIMNKYGQQPPKEIMRVLYNAMISCREEIKMETDKRLMFIDGLMFTQTHYATYRPVLKKYDLDDLVKIISQALDNKQGFFLTEEEKEYMNLGIISGSIMIEEVEKKKKKKL